jgi:hypothetical protein
LNFIKWLELFNDFNKVSKVNHPTTLCSPTANFPSWEELGAIIDAVTSFTQLETSLPSSDVPAKLFEVMSNVTMRVMCKKMPTSHEWKLELWHPRAKYICDHTDSMLASSGFHNEYGNRDYWQGAKSMDLSKPDAKLEELIIMEGHSPFFDGPGIHWPSSVCIKTSEFAAIPGRVFDFVPKQALLPIPYEQELYMTHTRESERTLDDVCTSPHHTEMFLASLKVLVTAMFRRPNNVDVWQWHIEYSLDMATYLESNWVQCCTVNLTFMWKKVLLRTQNKSYLLDDDLHEIEDLFHRVHTCVLHHHEPDMGVTYGVDLRWQHLEVVGHLLNGDLFATRNKSSLLDDHLLVVKELAHGALTFVLNHVEKSRSFDLTRPSCDNDVLGDPKSSNLQYMKSAELFEHIGTSEEVHTLYKTSCGEFECVHNSAGSNFQCMAILTKMFSVLMSAKFQQPRTVDMWQQCAIHLACFLKKILWATRNTISLSDNYLSVMKDLACGSLTCISCYDNVASPQSSDAYVFGHGNLMLWSDTDSRWNPRAIQCVHKAERTWIAVL